LLLVLLADGRLHSGEWLAKELGVSRAAVWKGIERLRTLGLEVQALPRRGYCLSSAVELLDARRIAAELGLHRRPQLRNLELLFEVDSTNSRLLAAVPPPPGFADAALSELQHAGRGRRGRNWIAPFGAGIALSMAWTFGEGAGALSALSLGVGVAMARALSRAGAAGVALKWPNDLVVDGETGIVVPSRDPVALRSALQRLLADPGLRRSLGAAGRERARERFSWDAVTDATLAAYAEAAGTMAR
jgi:BirA family biotin operon repressor/biotin-[acetyl-CoA-carboxylase] ligase